MGFQACSGSKLRSGRKWQEMSGKDHVPRGSRRRQWAEKIGSRLGLEIIAEGVEDETTLAALRSLGVRHAQGWLFHRPEPLERVLQ